MTEKRVLNAIKTRRLPMSLSDQILCILLSIICLAIFISNCFLPGIANLLEPFLILFIVIILATILFPIVWGYKLATYLSNKPAEDKLKIINALEDEVTNGLSVWPFTISNKHFYQFSYLPNWWSRYFIMSIIYTDIGYYINCHFAGKILDNNSAKTEEIIERIKQLEAGV